MQMLCCARCGSSGRKKFELLGDKLSGKHLAMRHLWPGPCGLSGGNPDGTLQSICWVPVVPGAIIGEPMFRTLNVLAGLFCAIASDGLPTPSWTVILSSPGVLQSVLAGLRLKFTTTGLVCPGS